jgi:hypothetical protein
LLFYSKTNNVYITFFHSDDHKVDFKLLIINKPLTAF